MISKGISWGEALKIEIGGPRANEPATQKPRSNRNEAGRQAKAPSTSSRSTQGVGKKPLNPLRKGGPHPNSSAATTKRPRSEGSTPEDKVVTKRPRGEPLPPRKPSGTYSQVAAGVRIGIAHANFPTALLESNIMEDFERAVREAIKRALEGPHRPSFRGLKWNSGWILVTCSNDDTASWLRNLVNNPEFLGEVPVKVLEEKDFPRPRIAVGYFPKSSEESNEGILSLVRAQNEHLNTSQWKVLKRDTRERLVTLTLGIDEASAGKFTAGECLVNYLFGQAKIRLVARGKPSKAPEETIKETTEEAEQMDSTDGVPSITDPEPPHHEEAVEDGAGAPNGTPLTKPPTVTASEEESDKGNN